MEPVKLAHLFRGCHRNHVVHPPSFHTDTCLASVERHGTVCAVPLVAVEYALGHVQLAPGIRTFDRRALPWTLELSFVHVLLASLLQTFTVPHTHLLFFRQRSVLFGVGHY